jgi:hypothetical protein
MHHVLVTRSNLTQEMIFVCKVYSVKYSIFTLVKLSITYYEPWYLMLLGGFVALWPRT